MSQNSLNLIAISIFLMTFSILLGPLIHLSPTIPALVTFTLLAIATVDTLSWQNQGTTLLLDWIANFSPKHRERIIHHEAGHFLVAHLLEFNIINYTLNNWEAMQQNQSGQGGVTVDDHQLTSQLQQGNLNNHILDRYCTIWMAGIVAEKLVFNDAIGGLDDQQKLAAILQGLGFSELAYTQKKRFHALQAQNLIQENWSAYQALVNAMGQRLSVSECIEVIDQCRLPKYGVTTK
ncbi:ATP-dependent Zn protease [Calothrix rhizosoleniae]|uniref:ATP-dependent Zn protease n=1 Tax=Calothrix rhizosoleniae TaxID=888997 RepID=UPI000B49BCAD|nr:ATP-dependent Zn protease [Calothrix rhizosoleniae]